MNAVAPIGTDPAEALQRFSERLRLHVAGAAAPRRSPGDSPSARSRLLASDDFDALIAAAAARVNLDPDLVKAVVAVESGFRPDAVSSAGAKGLMQLMDGTASALGVQDPFDPAQNLEGGTRFLRHLIDRYGDERLALAAYNAGPGTVERYGGLPPYAETRRYVELVAAAKEELRSRRA